MEGFLTKQGHIVKNWKVRWFNLQDNEISYYKDQTQFKMKRKCILLPHSTVESNKDIDVHKNIFTITIEPYTFRGIGKFIILSADNPQTKEKWITAIQNAIDILKNNKEVEDNYNKNLRSGSTTEKDVKDMPVMNRKMSVNSQASMSDEQSGVDESDYESDAVSPYATGQSRVKRSKGSARRKLKKDPVNTPKDVFSTHTMSSELPRNPAIVPVNSKNGSFQQEKQRSVSTAPPQSTFKASPHNGRSTSVYQETSPMSNNVFDTCVLPSFQPSSAFDDEPVPVKRTAKKTPVEQTPTSPQQFNNNEISDNENQESPSQKVSAEDKKKSKLKKTSLYDNWMEVQTEEGQTYYYHKVSRVTRWDKPEPHIAEAMEIRLQESQEASEKALRDRTLQKEREQELSLQNERIVDEAKIAIDKALSKWRKNKKRVTDDLSFPELLRDLNVIMPNDLLVTIYDSANRDIFLGLSDLTSTTDATQVKKTYLKIVRFIHPDKLPATLELESKLLCEQIFILLTEKFDLFRKAHGL